MDSADDLREFILGLTDNIVVYDSKHASPFRDGGDYVKFGQHGQVEQGVDMPLQDELDTTEFKQAVSNYAASKQRLIIKEWPTIRQHPKTKQFLIRATLVGDDGTRELISA